MRFFALTFLLAALAAPVSAQVYAGAEVGPDAFLRSEEPALDTTPEEAFSWAISVEVSSSVLYSVFESSAPETEIFKYLRHGIYRQELAAMLLLSDEKGVPFEKLAGELTKAGSFAALAKKHGADALDLFARGGRLKEAADRRLPLFITVSTAAAPGEIKVSTLPAISAPAAPGDHPL